MQTQAPTALQVAAGAIRGSFAVVVCGGDPFVAAQLGAIIGGTTGAIVGGLDGLAMSGLIGPKEQPTAGVVGATLGGVFGAARGAARFGLTVALAHAFHSTPLAGAACGAILSSI